MNERRDCELQLGSDESAAPIAPDWAVKEMLLHAYVYRRYCVRPAPTRTYSEYLNNWAEKKKESFAKRKQRITVVAFYVASGTKNKPNFAVLCFIEIVSKLSNAMVDAAGALHMHLSLVRHAV